ncbi:MAG: signal peptidase II [Chloroflexota bacterium]
MLVILGVCTACDQAVKGIAQQSLIGERPISLLNNLIRLEYVENAGAILGLGASLPSAVRLTLMSVFVAGALAMAFFFAYKPPPQLGWVQLAGVSLVAAGGLGNLIDRIFNQGRVIDFVSFGIGGLRTGVMNLADIAIFFGALIFFVFYRLDNPTRETTTT